MDEVRQKAFAMPHHSPSYPPGPYHFVDREYLIIDYRTDAEVLRPLIPAPLELADDEPVVKYEFIKMADSSGFGDYSESGQVIPVTLNGKRGGFVLSMYLNDHAPTAAGRELWGFPKKLAEPELSVHKDTLTGTLHYSDVRVALGTMGFKHAKMDAAVAKSALEGPAFLLKSMPHVDGTFGARRVLADRRRSG